MFVPTPVHREPESPRVRELSDQLEGVIAEFRRRYALSDAEIREALLRAAGRSAGAGVKRPMVAVLLAGIAAAGGLVALLTRAGEGGRGAADVPVVAIVLGILGVGLLIVLLRNRSG